MNNDSTKQPAATACDGRTVFPILFAAGFCHLLNDMIQSAVPAVFPILKTNLGLSFAQIGVITLVLQLTSSVFQPAAGWAADRHPRPYSLAAGMWFTLCGLVAFSQAGSFWLVLLSVALIGCGSSIFHPEASRIAQLASGGRKSLAQAIFQVGGNSGSAFGPLLTALLVLPHGMRAVGWLAFAALLCSGILFRVGRWYKALLTRGRGVAAAWQNRRETAGPGLSPWRVRAAMSILVLMLFSKYIYNACITNYFTFYLMEKFGVSVGVSQMCLFAYLAAFAAGTLFGGVLGDRYGRKYVILFSILGAAPFTLALPHLNLAGTIVAIVLAGLIIASAFSAIVVYGIDLMPNNPGMIAGVFFGLMFGLGGIGSAAFGWLADRTGLDFIFHLSAWLPLLGIAAFYLPNLETTRRAAQA